MPTGSVSRAEISAMCSLPLPDASESATSKSSFSKGRRAFWISSLKVMRSLDESTSRALQIGFEKGICVDLSFTRIICSRSSMRLIRAEICP